MTRPTRMMHSLKTWNDPFQAIMDGLKRFEFRKDDREFRVGDSLRLREWNPDTKEYSGREIRARVTYVLREDFGLQPGFVVMSIRREFASLNGVIQKFDD